MPRGSKKAGVQGWMVVLRPDDDAKKDGVEEEVFKVIYTKLERAMEECRHYIRDLAKDDREIGDDHRIEWMKDSSSTADQEVWFGRPHADMEDSFYLYEIRIEM